MSIFKKNKSPIININGIAYSFSEKEFYSILPVVVGYALNELELPSRKALELAVLSIYLSNISNHPEGTGDNNEWKKILESAQIWKQTNDQADILTESAKNIIQVFLQKGDNPISLDTIFLKCVISMDSINEEDICEAEYHAIKGLYSGLTSSNLTDDEFITLYKKLADEIIMRGEEPLDCFTSYAPALHFHKETKEFIIKLLFMVAASSGNITEEQLKFISLGASAFQIEVKRYKEILAEAYEEYKNI